jgi:molybdopterin synthase catalytic subunit
MLVAPEGSDWIAMSANELPTADAMSWAVAPSCGAVVTFCGTVRDHSEGRTGVTFLEYEAYAEQVEPRLQAVADAARRRWPVIGRIALLHRIGRLAVGEVSVVVVVSTPNRPESFAAARFCIDTLKAAVPIWKRETWSGGSDWSVCDHEIDDVDLDHEAHHELLEEIDRLSGLGGSTTEPVAHTGTSTRS